MQLTFLKMEVFLKHPRFWFLLKCGLTTLGSAFLQSNVQLDVGGHGPLLLELALLPQSSPLLAVSDPNCVTPLPA